MNVGIDWTIKFGDVLTMAVIALGGLGFLYTMRGKVDGLSTDVSKISVSFQKMQEKMTELATAVATIAVAEQKISAVNARVDDEKREGEEFRHWLRNEIARLWSVIGTFTEEVKEMNKSIGVLQGKLGNKD